MGGEQSLPPYSGAQSLRWISVLVAFTSVAYANWPAQTSAVLKPTNVSPLVDLHQLPH